VDVEMLLDLAFERALLLFENLDVPLDLPAQFAFLQFKQPPLLFEFPLEELKGWERHVGLTLHDD
jgi:hypothetical protein